MQSQCELELDQLAEELTLCRELDKDGNICYYNEEDKLHRVHGPAVIWDDGLKYWYIDDTQYTKEQFNLHPDVIEYAKSK